MGDKVGIPRSYSDQIGVADVKSSLKRHYLPIPILHPKNDTTTGNMWGINSNTTRMPFLQRNVTFERLLVSGFKNTTVVGKTTLLNVRLMKDGASTVFDLTLSNSTTLGERWHSGSVAPSIVNGNNAGNFHLEIPTRNAFTKLSAVLVFRERNDD